MYDELVKQLREADEKSMCGECGLNLHTGATKKGVLFAEAADAIEELTGFVQEAERDRDEYRERLDKANDAVEELKRKEKFHAFLWSTIQPNEMEQYLSMYRAQAVPSQPPKEG